MKTLILLSFFVILICFSADSAEKRLKFEEKQKFRVEFTFWVTKEAKYLDPLKVALLDKKSPELVEMVKSKQIQKLKEKDRLEILEVGQVIGTPYVKAQIIRRGRKEGSVYIFDHFLRQFCKQETK